MYASLRREIPAFINEQVVYCANIVLPNKLESTVLLTRQLQLYEFRSKKLLNQLDLSASCLAQEKQRLLHYKGAKSKWFLPDEEAAEAATHVINFGKFVYNNACKTAYYLLLQCWQQLLVVQRLEDAGLRLVKEWSNVQSFQLVHGTIEYQPVLQVHFVDGHSLKTDLEEESAVKVAKDDADIEVKLTQIKEAQQLQTELKIQQELCKRELQRYCDAQYFGNHLIRSTEIEEMQPLTCYSDVWMRITSADKLVIGVPLVNSCVRPNLTILKRIQAILLPTNTQQLDNYNYKCHLYQLKQRFEDLHSLETYFQASEQQEAAYGWLENKNWQMLPESFAVLVMVLNMQDVVLLDGNCPLFISYEIEKNLQLLADKPPKIQAFKLQLFVKQLNFKQIFAERQQLLVNFKPNTLHQDFLAITSSHYELKLCLQFNNNADAEQFERLFVEYFQCEVVKRENKLHNTGLDMHLEEEQLADAEFNHFPQFLLYNKQPQSMWYGLLAAREPGHEELQWLWKFYVANEARGVMLLRMLLEDLLREGVNVQRIEQVIVGMEELAADPIAALTRALNLEMQHIIDVLSACTEMNEATYKEKLTAYIKLQLDTDLAMAASEKKYKDQDITKEYVGI